ncbi:polyprenol monophosphomannose synthase [candidate division WS5 bacterium]|uniref:Polyprenol monophosphomannose synthase n=1 Tax=candidate division WS5 bacterium TaxID=2093353 RepID=A0A419DBW5_9BACT|nr:MAG: polyprenol monophosphomannose synthase [candidate division WS5 bacterium]
MKTIVFIPTYNERENIEKLIDEILNLNIDNLEVLIVDDNSPDGTWKIVEDIERKKKSVHLLLRKEEKGRGNAGKSGFKFAVEHKADYIIEMDADFSHHPREIPKLLNEIRDADLILGSRLILGGKDVGRGIVRELITKLSNLYIRLLLGLKVKDCNSGFRCFRREVLEAIDIDKLESKGPTIVQEVLFKSYLKGFKIKEVPITFTERAVGKSKLFGIKHLWQGYYIVLRLKTLKMLRAI